MLRTCRQFVLAFLLSSSLGLALAAHAEEVSFFGIKGEHLPEWSVLTDRQTLIFRADTQDAWIRVSKADLSWQDDDFEVPARLFAEGMGGRNIRYVEGNVEFETAQGEQAFLERFGNVALLFTIHGQGDDFYRVLGSIALDEQVAQ